MSLRRLGVERIDLWQLHRIDNKFPAEDQIGELAALQQEGKIRHIGLSNVSVEQLKRARAAVEIVSVQNRYNLGDRASEDVLEHCGPDSLQIVGRVAVAAVESIATRLAKIDRFARTPSVEPVPQPEAPSESLDAADSH